MRKLSLLFIAAVLTAFLPVYSEAEVLSKINVTDLDGKSSYYDNFGSLIEDRVIFKEYKERPGLYYPDFKNTPAVGSVFYKKNKNIKSGNIVYNDRIWIEFDVLSSFMDGEWFSKGTGWFGAKINVPMQYVYDIKPFKLKFAVAVENSIHAQISIYQINARVDLYEDIFLTFFKAINERTPLKVAGWLYTVRYSLALTKQELYGGYLRKDIIIFEPLYAIPLWWKRESADMAGDRNRSDIQAP